MSCCPHFSSVRSSVRTKLSDGWQNSKGWVVDVQVQGVGGRAPRGGERQRGFPEGPRGRGGPHLKFIFFLKFKFFFAKMSYG